MPVSKKSSKKTSRKPAVQSGKKKAKSSFLYNPMDPFNQYPNHETGEEEYGPIPPFGFNKNDPMNMQPFNPNVMNAMFGGGPIYNPPRPSHITYGPGPGNLLMPPPFNMLGVQNFGLPNPSMPLLQPMVPSPPGIRTQVSPLPPLPTPGVNWYGMHTLSPQQYHPTDPNNQFPNPLTGSMTEPGPALEGGMNSYDPYNVIGAPHGTPAQNEAMRKKMMQQPRHPRSPYIME